MCDESLSSFFSPLISSNIFWDGVFVEYFFSAFVWYSLCFLIFFSNKGKGASLLNYVPSCHAFLQSPKNLAADQGHDDIVLLLQEHEVISFFNNLLLCFI